MDDLVRLIEVTPGTPLETGGFRIASRWNHHFLPYGTLGLKFTACGKTWGISGDTKFSTRINQIINRSELEPDWFSDCDLVFHEIDFFNPDGVHSHWEEVAKIQNHIPGTLYGYHSPEVDDPPVPLVRQGQIFRL